MRLDLGGMGIFGVSVLEVNCPECEGTGKVVADPCSACSGSGRVISASEVVVDIPADSHDGDEIRVAGMGNAGTNGREAGDFVCRVGVEDERLEPRQAAGFRMVGIGLPMLALGIVYSGIFTVLVGAIMCAIGAAGIVREGVKNNARWWREGLQAVWSGLLTGLALGLLFVVMTLRPSLIATLLFLAVLFLPLFMSRRS